MMSHDSLTGLPNRYHLSRFLRKAKADGTLSDYWIAVADIDDFKAINDTYGHNCGDYVPEFESKYIAAQILGDVSPICYPVVPNLVFTLPRIAQVGVTLVEAKANPDDYRIDEWHYGPQNEWVDNRELDIDMTLVLDNDGHLVGAAIYGSEAGTWIDFLTLVINTKLTGADIRAMIFTFPTQTYMLASHLATTLVGR